MFSSLQTATKDVPLNLRQLSLPSPLTIVVLAPHPDDFDAIAATLQFFHQRGDALHLAVLTTGVSGVEDGYAGAHTDADKAALREQEQTASCAFFGLPVERVSFLRLPPDEKGNPRLDTANHESIRDYLLQRKPDLVFMPHGNDSNVTHQRTYALFRAVALAENLQLWAVLNQDAKTLAMRTDLVTTFDAATATWKAEMLRLHQSQHQRNLNTRGHGFDERVLTINRKSALVLNLDDAEYAECFELERFG
ncbi:LmbE family N-acetylglucosaminyl deacetylase [Herminiimonas fonticola]|uniref:LmbE family N-acetylglucosaminyl deacetylase n=2 Tax=Herminiimonas fonticola TaxID=303380 RepID=A0A4R6GHE6_9BURK|nr:GlcNAc-PI de-N-acetylase [Herminiimonas fonticola]TDN93644.1 LmbE family N-acetylglucosaminyl deacetylase [Herminiimonas fonticola]